MGNPAVARAAVESGKVDMVALGRTLIADPDWARNVRSGAPVRRCLSCNHCVNSMRSGAHISCVVNPIAGHELDFADPGLPEGEKICVVGAGPAGLSYASLVADRNSVTVIERAPVAGGTFRFTGKAALFDEVEAAEGSFEAYVAGLEEACRERGVRFRYGLDVTRKPQVLTTFDRVVFATGARFRYGLDRVVPRLLDSGLGKSKLGRRIFSSPRVREWLYYGARRSTGPEARRLARAGQKVTVIGDAAGAGKARDAVDGAFRAALLAQQEEAAWTQSFGTS
jgi:dimethylglycine catabolism A